MRATRRCVLLFTRTPRAETRAKKLSGAEPLFVAVARRVAEAAGQAGFDLLVVGADRGRAQDGSRHLWQRGRDFAERLGNAFADAWAMGYAQIVVVPGDVPGISAAVLAQAGAALEAGHTVLGPSPDGGVYLIGLAGREGAHALEGVRWRTGEVFADLLARLPASAAHVLRPLSDVDRWRDLDRIAREGHEDPELRRLIRTIRGRALLLPAGREALLPAPPGLGIDPERGPPLLLS